MMLKNYYKTGNDAHTLCWDCAKCIGGCSWSKEFKPVDGWDAVPTIVKIAPGGHNRKPRITNSFKVLSCPEFERDSYNHGSRWVDKEKHRQENYRKLVGDHG
jgi:hypothetical protein